MKPGDTAAARQETAGRGAPRVLLLVPARTYRAADFLTAAARLGLDLVIGSDGALPLGSIPVVRADPADPGRSAARLVAAAGRLTPLSPRTPRCWSWPRPWRRAWAWRTTRRRRWSPPPT